MKTLVEKGLESAGQRGASRSAPAESSLTVKDNVAPRGTEIFAHLLV